MGGVINKGQTYLTRLRYYHSKYILPMEAFTELDHKLRADFDKLNKKAAYGTAGFRDLAVNMPYVRVP